MSLEQTEIPGIIASVIEVKKKSGKRYLSNNTGYFDGYLEYCSWKEAISNHTVKGKKPIDMISIKSPYQTQEELDYVIANFKQITLPVSFEFLSVIGRGLHDSNWSIDYALDQTQYVNADMTFKKYLEEDIASTPLQMSYDSWMKFVLPSIKINDSMGVIAFKPHVEERTVEVEGEFVIAGDTLPEPTPYYFSCDRVLSSIADPYVLVETPRKSVVTFNSKKVRDGLVFELYDDQNIWVIEQVGNKTDWEFETRLYFNHALGFVPVTYLKGIARYTDEGVLQWQSPFLLVTDILDEALLDGCNLRSMKASSAYPQKMAIGNECQFSDPVTFQKCSRGFILDKDGKNFHKCPECMGSGLVQRTSPLNTILVKPRTSIDDGDQIKPSDALAYISPDPAMPTLIREEITQAILNAMSILHLKTTNTAVKGAEDMTATGMVMDEKGKYAFIKSVVDQIFDIYEFGMKCIGMMRYGTDFEMPIIQRPISYDFNSEGDYLMQISAATSAGAPPSVIASYIYKYLKAIFYDNPQTAKAYDLIIAADRLFVMTKADILQEISRNLIAPFEVVLHDSALTFIGELVRENENFLYQDVSVMIEQLKAKAIENTPESPASTARLNTANILGNANA